MKKNYICIMLVSLCLIACNNQDDKPHEIILTAASIVASYNDVNITIEDMDTYLKTLPINERWNSDNTLDWYKAKIKVFSINEKINEDARHSKIKETNSYKINARAIKRNAFSNFYIQSHTPKNTISDESILKYYNDNISKYQYPEERLVYHIFKRIDEEHPEEDVITVLNDLKNRVIKGENFKLLAEQYSDSESRHKKGFLGKFALTKTPNDFLDVAFSINKQTPSEPVRIGNGYHIFYVSDILDAYKTSFKEVKPSIYSYLRDIYYQENLKQLVASIQDLQSFEIISSADLNNLKSGLIKNKKLFQVGKYSLDFNQLKEELTVFHDLSRKLSNSELNIERISEIAYREVLYQELLRNDFKYPESKKLNKTLDILMINLYKDKLMRDFLVQHKQDLENYYDNNKKRYYSQPKFNIEYIKVNKLNNTNMGILEKASISLNNKQLTFKELSEKLNINIQHLNLIENNQLEQYNSALSKITLSLKEGQFSHPFTDSENIYLIKLVKKIKGAPQLFDDIFDQIVESYISENNQKIILSISKEILDEIELTIYDDTIIQYIKNPSDIL